MTVVMGAFERLYAAGAKPVVVRSALVKTPDGSGVGKVKEATPPVQVTVEAVPSDCVEALVSTAGEEADWESWRSAVCACTAGAERTRRSAPAPNSIAEAERMRLAAARRSRRTKVAAG